MVGEWEYRDGRIFDSKYNENGQIQHTEQWDKDELVATKEYTYDQQSGKLIKETEQQVADNTKRERHYDQEGNLVSETEGAADKTPVEYTYTYDGDKRVSTRKKSDIGVEEWRFFYDGDGSLKKEEYYRRGFLQMQTVYTGEDSWYEELFHNDEVIIRIYFDKEKKVREEFIQDGNVVRTKEY